VKVSYSRARRSPPKLSADNVRGLGYGHGQPKRTRGHVGARSSAKAATLLLADREAEIGEIKRGALGVCGKDVLGLEVTMGNAHGMAVAYGRDNLKEDALDLIVATLELLFIDEVVQVATFADVRKQMEFAVGDEVAMVGKYVRMSSDGLVDTCLGTKIVEVVVSCARAVFSTRLQGLESILVAATRNNTRDFSERTVAQFSKDFEDVVLVDDDCITEPVT
jgi:hypothetical protein